MWGMICTHSDIIGLWPSNDDLALDIDEKPGTVRKWRQRNSIPADKWLSVVRAARRRGLAGVTLELLAKIASGEISGEAA